MVQSMKTAMPVATMPSSAERRTSPSEREQERSTRPKSARRGLDEKVMPVDRTHHDKGDARSISGEQKQGRAA